MDKLDILLHKQPITVPTRENLTRDTLVSIKQIKRIRFARRMMLGVLAIMSILFIAKWLNNDLVYLLQLVLTKFTFIKIQSGLYIAAFVESLPKQQFFLMIIAGILWYCWRRFETFFNHSRITIKKQTLAMKLIRLTPQLLILNTFVIIIAIGLTGYSYAQKNDQLKLQILRESINQTGRKELEINVSPEQCDATNNPNLTNLYEIKKDANLHTSDAVNVIEAACNNSETEKFLHQNFPSKMNSLFEDNATTIVSQVVEKNGDNLLIKPPSVSYNLNPDPIRYTLSKNTKVYKEKKLVPLASIKKGDIIMLLNKFQYESKEGGDPISTRVLGVYILPQDPEFSWYNLSLQHAVTQIETCPGNPNDRCTFTGSIDFFPSGGDEGNTKNELFVQSSDGTTKEIAGVLTEITDRSVKIKTSSNRIFTINFGSNPTKDFNRDRAQYYNNDKVTLGDTLLVTYSEIADSHSTTINTDQIFNAVLMLETINKTDTIKKY